MSLRQHVKDLHKKIKPARSNADLEKQHARDHHQFITNHNHGSSKAGTGASDRPAGWKTGEDVRMIKKP